MRIFALCALLAPALLLAQKPELTEIRLRTDPADARVRPLEQIAVQLMTYGTVEGLAEQVRIQRNGATWKITSDNGGWLSKPYRFQGEESEEFYRPEGKGLASLIYRQAASQFLLQDAALYTAPEKEGVYKIEATLEGKTAQIEITVAADAVARKPVEEQAFRFEPISQDPYLRLAAHWAPFIAQETWFQPKADYIARFDLDGDWSGENNWDNAEIGSSQAYVYYAAMETPTHWFLIYNIFHPRDYSDKCIAGSCHENDNEGLILTVRKDGSQFGALEVMETLAHNNVYSHVADSSIRGAAHNVDGKIELVDGSHPAVFIESGGHGVYGSSGSHSRYVVAEDRFTAGPGVTYVYTGLADRPRHPDSRRVGYELLPIWDHWWLRAHEGPGRDDRTFDAYYRYVPEGNRPRAPYGEIAGSFWGRTQSENKAKPFWGWHDNRTRKKGVLATGQWGLDPAYAVSQNLRFAKPVSTDYTFNPYLGVQADPSSLAGGAGEIQAAQ